MGSDTITRADGDPKGFTWIHVHFTFTVTGKITHDFEGVGGVEG